MSFPALSGHHEDEGLLEQALATISHDLRSPLAVIIGYAELLQTRDDERTRREAAVRIQEAAERLLVMIDETVATARQPEKRSS